MARKIDEQKNLKTRNEIIDTSIKIILEKGFSKFTLSEVAKRLGVTKATIYWYYASKEDLITNIADKIWISEIDSISDYESANMNAKDKLMNLLFQGNDIYSCILPAKFLFEYYCEDSEIKAKIQKGYEQYHKSLLQILHEGKINGEFHYDISESEIASFIISAFDGMAINRFSLKESYTLVSKDNLLILLQSILKY